MKFHLGMSPCIKSELLCRVSS